MLESDPITGVMVQYYYTCHRELWFYANRINMNYDDQNIKIGRQIQEESYGRDSHHRNVLVDGAISIDIIEDENTVYEVKKSSSLEEASIMQLKYYLWYLKREKDLEMDGILAYPKERNRRRVELTPDDEQELEEAIADIREIISLDSPPEREEKPFCEACSFYDLCWV
jgi:CRISPR-associated exonuclease Cas4